MFPTDPVPDTLGAYKVLRRLAVSGSVSVFLGRMDGPMGFQRTCDLKLVPNAAEGEPRFAEELAREAAICAQLNHPAIVRMFDFFEHQGKLVLVLEHVEGTNLDRLLQHLVARRQKLGDAAAYYVAHSVASALAHAHAATDGQGTPTPVIYRNLHPANIVLGWDGQVRLTGFGLGKILGLTPDTVAGIVKGTPGYMAPEQVSGDKVSPETDVYGVGLLLWSLLSGRSPPQDGTRPVGISTLRPDLPLSIVAIIDTALSLLPEDRTIPCSEIEQILGKVVRPETGKSELVLRIQSAHSSIELEDVKDPDDRPTIPASKARTGQTARPSGSLKSSGEEAKASPRPPLKGAASADARFPLRVPPPPPKEKPSFPKRGPPRAAPSPNGPKGAPPKDEAPKDEAPKVEAPKVEAPKVEAPKVEAPKANHVTAPLALAMVEPEEPAGADAAGPFAALLIAPNGAPAGEPFSPAAPLGLLDGEGAPVAPLEPFPVSHHAPVTSVESPAAPGLPMAFSPLPNSVLAEPPLVTPLRFGPPPSAAAPSTFLGKVWAHPLGQIVAGRAQAVWLHVKGPRALSILTTVAISAVTATLVAVIWSGVGGRDPDPSDAAVNLSRTSPLPSDAKSSPPAPTRVPAALQAPTAPLAVPGAPGNQAPRVERPASLSAGMGDLTVVSSVDAGVYINGRNVGPVNQSLPVPCGPWFVRLGRPVPGRFPEWVSIGKTVKVDCQAPTQVEFQPLPAVVAPR